MSSMTSPRGAIGPIVHIHDNEEQDKETKTKNKPPPTYDPRFLALTPDEYDHPIYKRNEEMDMVARLTFDPEQKEVHEEDSEDES